jgi:hypothetical protein
VASCAFSELPAGLFDKAVTQLLRVTLQRRRQARNVISAIAKQACSLNRDA